MCEMLCSEHSWGEWGTVSLIKEDPGAVPQKLAWANTAGHRTGSLEVKAVVFGLEGLGSEAMGGQEPSKEHLAWPPWGQHTQVRKQTLYTACA